MLSPLAAAAATAARGGRRIQRQQPPLRRHRHSLRDAATTANVSAAPVPPLPFVSVGTRHNPRRRSAQATFASAVPRPAEAPAGATATASYAPIYVSATRQHVGKTSVSLALISGLTKRFPRIGFLKPVGQISVTVSEPLPPYPGAAGASGAGGGYDCAPDAADLEDPPPRRRTLQVDKDAALVKEHFGLSHVSYADASPLMVPPGYTRAYLDGRVSLAEQEAAVAGAYRRVAAASDVVLCEGTGHVAVGSVVGLSNARVAQLLGARMVLVANGGLGSALDELALNWCLCEAHDVPVAGVIMNKVMPDKLEQTRDYVGRALQERWGVPLLGLVPDRRFLGSPALADLERLLPGSSIVSGAEHRLRHYRVRESNLSLVATSLSVFLHSLRHTPDRTLYVCHASRNDILLGFLMEAQQQHAAGRRTAWETAMVVTGCAEHPISAQVLEIVTGMPNAPPVLLAPQPTGEVVERLYHLTPKLNADDAHRVQTTVDHYEPCIDFDQLLERVAVPGASRVTAVQ